MNSSNTTVSFGVPDIFIAAVGVYDFAELVLMLIFAFILKNQQPLKSRGFITYFSFLSLTLLFVKTPFLLIEYFNHLIPSCYWYLFFCFKLIRYLFTYIPVFHALV